MRTLIQDQRYGARMLLKNKGFTLVVVLSPALGIGANSTIFSIGNALLLKPFPFEKPADGELAVRHRRSGVLDINQFRCRVGRSCIFVQLCTGATRDKSRSVGGAQVRVGLIRPIGPMCPMSLREIF